MQTTPINPFPMSDNPADKPVAPAPPVAPSATPVTTPQAAPQSSIFVQPAAAPTSDASLKGFLGKMEQIFLKIFSSPALQMPEFIRDMISRFLPWLTLMTCFILAPLVVIGFAMGGFLGFITSFYELNTNAFYWLTIVLLLAQLVLMGLAIPKLLHEKRAGWNLVFIATLLGGLTVLANVFAQFVQPILGTLVGFATFAFILYVIFQARSYYSD